MSKSRANEIKVEQYKLKKELDSIQSTCKHERKTIRWDDDGRSYRWTCDECNAYLNYPTPQDMEDYIKH